MAAEKAALVVLNELMDLNDEKHHQKKNWGYRKKLDGILQ